MKSAAICAIRNNVNSQQMGCGFGSRVNIITVREYVHCVSPLLLMSDGVMYISLQCKAFRIFRLSLYDTVASGTLALTATFCLNIEWLYTVYLKPKLIHCKLFHCLLTAPFSLLPNPFKNAFALDGNGMFLRESLLNYNLLTGESA